MESDLTAVTETCFFYKFSGVDYSHSIVLGGFDEMS